MQERLGAMRNNNAVLTHTGGRQKSPVSPKKWTFTLRSEGWKEWGGLFSVESSAYERAGGVNEIHCWKNRKDLCLRLDCDEGQQEGGKKELERWARVRSLHVSEFGLHL